jgi:hypothetical protein
MHNAVVEPAFYLLHSRPRFAAAKTTYQNAAAEIRKRDPGDAITDLPLDVMRPGGLCCAPCHAHRVLPVNTNGAAKPAVLEAFQPVRIAACPD